MNGDEEERIFRLTLVYYVCVLSSHLPCACSAKAIHVCAVGFTGVGLISRCLPACLPALPCRAVPCRAVPCLASVAVVGLDESFT